MADSPVPVIDERTTERGYKMPHPDNDLRSDAQRLREALQAIDRDVEKIERRASRRAIPAAASFRIRVIAEAFAPGTASVTAKVETGSANNFQALTVASAQQIGDGWVEVEWSAMGLAGIGADKTTRVRLEIANSAAHRAAVRNLRAVIV